MGATLRTRVSQLHATEAAEIAGGGQIGLPVAVNADELARKKTLAAALDYCAEIAGFALDKELQVPLGVDKSQFSRWHAGTEGIMWPKFVRLMDICGNDAPLLWMLMQRGYDVRTLRKTETETERENRELREELTKERAEREAVERALRRMVVGEAK